MAAEQQVTIVIVGKDMASKVFQAVGSSAEKAGKQVEKGFADKLAKVGKAATSVGKKLSIGVTAPLAMMAGVSVNAAIKAERLTKTLTAMAGGADEAANYIDAIKKASLGTVPQVDALAIANRALSFGVVKNTEDMKRLTEVAIVLGRSQGLTAAVAVSDLTTAMSRQSPMILDNLGITLKLTEAYDIYSAKIGVSVDQLTKEQKAMAFREAALIKGEEAMARMGGVQDDMAASGERVKAQMADLSVTIGQSLVPMMQSGLNIIGPLIQKFADADPAVQKLVIGFGMVAAGIGPVMAMFGTLATGIASFTSAIAAAGGGLSGFSAILNSAQGQMLGIGAAIGAVAMAWMKYNELQAQVARQTAETMAVIDGWNTVADEMISEGADLGTVLDDLSERVNDASAAMEEGGIVADIFVDQTSLLNAAASETEGIIRENTETYETYTAAVEEYNSNVDDSAAVILSATEAERLANEIRQSSAVYMSEESAMAEVLRSNIVRLSEEEYRASQRTQAYAEGQGELRYAMLRTADAAESSIGPVSWNTQAISEAVPVMDSGARAALALAEGESRAAAEAANLAAQQAIAKQAAIESAQSFLDLSMALMDATEKQVAATLIKMMDPEEMGAEAYTLAVTGVGKSFGLMDDKSIALADSLPKLASALSKGIIPAENSAKALTLLVDAATDGNVVFPDILAEFQDMPAPLGEMATKGDGAAVMMRKLGKNSDVAGGQMKDAGVYADDLAIKLDKLDREVVLSFRYETTGALPTPGAGAGPGGYQPPEYQHGIQRVPGPPWQASLAWVHGQETITPAGNTTTRNNTYGGDTYNVTINNQMAAALFLDQQRRERFARIDARM